METVEATAEALKKQINAAEQELAVLKQQLHQVNSRRPQVTHHEQPDGLEETYPWPLSDDEYKRYGRQMIVPHMGIQGKTLSNRLSPHILTS